MTVVQQNEANLPPTATSMTVTITSELPAAEAGEPTHITDAPEPTKIIDGSESNDHGHHDTNPDDKGSEEYDDSQSSSDHEDNNKGSFPEPKLRLEIRDLGHPGAVKFLGAVNAGTVLSDAVKNVQRLLYRLPSDPHTNMPPTRSVTVILRDMGGVAYTTGVRNFWLSQIYLISFFFFHFSYNLLILIGEHTSPFVAAISFFFLSRAITPHPRTSFCRVVYMFHSQ